MNNITTTPSDPIPAHYMEAPLSELVSGIEVEFGRAEKAVATALEHGINCGQMLRAAKEQVPHGSWMKWVEDYTNLPHSTVTTFMHLAANSQRVGNLSTIRGALKLLADAQKQDKPRQISQGYVSSDGKTPPPEPVEPATPVLPASPATSQRLPQIEVDAEIVEPAAPATAPAQAELETLAEIEPEEPPAPAIAAPTASPAPSLIETSETTLAEILGLLPHLRPAEIRELHQVLESRLMKTTTSTAATLSAA
jgi:hypothetical protein